VSHPRCVGEHNISKTAVEIVFNTTVYSCVKDDFHSSFAYIL